MYIGSGGVLLTNGMSAEIKDENNNVNKNIDSINKAMTKTCKRIYRNPGALSRL